MSIFFITGTSGSGKTTLTHYLKMKLPSTSFAVYDFDENGVPPHADELWRKDTTDRWLIKAQENDKLGKSTVICGVSVPSEVLSSSKKPHLPIYFGFLKIGDKVIEQRLRARNWSEHLIQDNVNWAHYLEAEVKKHEDHLIVDSFQRTPAEVADIFIGWILHVHIDILPYG